MVTWFFEKNKDAAYALAVAFGAIATVAITAFAVDKITSWVTSIQGAVKWVTAAGYIGVGGDRCKERHHW